MAELSKAMEQYLEIIYEIESHGKEASVSDIAEAKGVKAPSVTYVLKKLSEPEYALINYEKYNRGVSLTSKGRKIAEKLERTHQTLLWFLEAIGIDPDVADEDACEMEHIIRPETIDTLTNFVDWIKTNQRVSDMIKRFREDNA